MYNYAGRVHKYADVVQVGWFPMGHCIKIRVDGGSEIFLDPVRYG